MPAEKRLPESRLSGSDAYEFAKSVTMAGIARQNPGITEEQAQQVFAWRLERCKQAEENERKLRESVAANDLANVARITDS